MNIRIHTYAHLLAGGTPEHYAWMQRSASHLHQRGLLAVVCGIYYHWGDLL
jgi:hypothetical protein